MVSGEDLARVWVADGHETSGGWGPGEVIIPRAEALLLKNHARIIGPAGSEGDSAAARNSRVCRIRGLR